MRCGGLPADGLCARAPARPRVHARAPPPPRAQLGEAMFEHSSALSADKRRFDANKLAENFAAWPPYAAHVSPWVDAAAKPALRALDAVLVATQQMLLGL